MQTQKYFLSLSVLLLFSTTVCAQMERQRVQMNQPVTDTFWASNIVGMGTVETLYPQNLNVTIMHVFGVATDRPVQNFFGLDTPPNVRLGLEYGLMPGWTVGIGRTTFQKVVDIRSKVALWRQSTDGSVPLSLALIGDAAVSTQENRQPFSDDLSYFLGSAIACKFSKRLSMQLMPAYARYNKVDADTGEQRNLWVLGLGAEIHLSQRYALSGEYLPVLGDRNTGTRNAFALALNIDTGGHVFQFFFASSDWTTEQYIVARNQESFWAGDFRFGFNVNRLFRLGNQAD